MTDGEIKAEQRGMEKNKGRAFMIADVGPTIAHQILGAKGQCTCSVEG